MFLGKTPKELLTAFYREKNPSKVDEVDKLLAKYKGREEKLFINLANKYKMNPAMFGVKNVSTTGSSFGQASPLGGNSNFAAMSTPGSTPFGANSTSNGFGTFGFSAAQKQSTPFGSTAKGSTTSTPFGGASSSTTFGSFADAASKSPGFGGGTNTSPFGGPRR